MILMKTMRQYLPLLLTLFMSVVYAQETDLTEDREAMAMIKDSLSQKIVLSQDIAIDTVRTDSTLIEGKAITLIDHIEVSDFDKKWLESWRNNVIDSTLLIKPEDTVGKVVIENFSTELLKERIAHLDSQTPFNFEYNPSLEKIIKHYLKNRQQTTILHTR
jgi:membrane-bound lytic murein transglycosylase D